MRCGYIYSRPDAMWTEIGMLTKLHNLWLNWLVEYEDGSYEGGYAWRGRPGTGFAAAHHVIDGVSVARSDARVVPHFTERGSVRSVELHLGDEVSVDLPQAGSTDWPPHTCGTRASTSRGKRVARSWNFTEFFPLNWQAVADYQEAHRRLFGRYPSFQRLMTGVRIEDQRLVFPARTAPAAPGVGARAVRDRSLLPDREGPGRRCRAGVVRAAAVGGDQLRGAGRERRAAQRVSRLAR
jgi:hypothetical protein